jgi:penicillin-binding protein 2
MERVTRTRARILLALFLVVALLFGFKLYDLQVIQTGGSTDNTATFTVYTTVKAARGDILDTKGNVLVSNRASYNLVMNHYVLLTADGTNEYLYQLVRRCKEAGIEYNEHFPISQQRPFTYTLSQYNSSWQSHFQTFLNLVELDSDISAPLLVSRLRDYYKIPKEWSDEDARLVIGLRYEMDLRSCVGSLPIYVFLEDISDQALSSIMELNIPGLTVEASTVREYNTKYAAHILGYVGPMNAEQWETYKNNKDYTMDSEIGQDGFEAAFEEYLHGVDGLREDTVTTSGELVSSRYIIEPKAGSNVEVSIDINLQRAAEETLEQVISDLRAQEAGKDGHDAEGGAVVALDVKTGQVLVCASYPTYDLSTFFEDYNAILGAEHSPLFNRALQGTYPPGSTYKMSMVVAGINSGIINSETKIYDRGIWDQDGAAGDKYKDFQLYCLQYTNYGEIHEHMNAAEALMVSCNYFFYELGDRIGLSAMDSTAKGLGLGERTGIELPEYIGHRANAETKKLLYTGDEAGWWQADQVTAAIGQSDNRFTPMQLCVYASTLANRGTRYRSTFLNRVVSADYRSLLKENKPTVQSTFNISDDAYLAYTQGMYLVTHGNGYWSGTASKVFKNYPIEVAAKTGTAQTDSGGSDNGAFVCYAPYDEPRIAIAVYGEQAGHGSTLANVAKAILDVYFEVGEIGDVTTNENQVS